MQVILDKLKTNFDYASVCAKLNQYFPKSELHSAGAVRKLYISVVSLV